jgi:hypothetical protein
MAIQIWGGAWLCYHFCDRGPHSAQTEQSGETALLISLSQQSQFYRPSSAQTEQSGETALLISPSQQSQFYRPSSAQTEQSAETASLISPSQLPSNLIS